MELFEFRYGDQERRYRSESSRPKVLAKGHRCSFAHHIDETVKAPVARLEIRSAREAEAKEKMASEEMMTLVIVNVERSMLAVRVE